MKVEAVAIRSEVISGECVEGEAEVDALEAMGGV